MYNIRDPITKYKEHRFTRKTNTDWQNLTEIILLLASEVPARRENAIEAKEF
jgi:hypothetical protein